MPTISNLPTLTNLAANTVFPVVDVSSATNHVSKKTTFKEVIAYLTASVVTSLSSATGATVFGYTPNTGNLILSDAAFTGQFLDILGRPNTYPVATASNSTLGGVVVGANIQVTSSGTISVNVATSSTLGLVRVGSGINLNGGLISVSPATTSTLGGVKIGSGITVDVDGTISAPNQYVLPTATSVILGGVIIGSGLSIDDSGVLSNNSQIASGDTAPLNATTGTLWYDDVGGRLYIYYDNSWVDSNPSVTGRAYIVSGATPPANDVQPGTLWYDDVGGRMYLYYSNTWVETSPALLSTGTGNASIVVSDIVPATASTGTLWYDEVVGRLFIYFENTWVDAAPGGSGAGQGLPFDDGDLQVTWTPTSSYSFPYSEVNGITIGSSSATVTRGNTIVGFESGVYIEQGFTFTGVYSVWGTDNSLFGGGAGYNLTKGSDNTYIGYNAGSSNTQSSFNTLVGTNAGTGIEEGSFNTALGWGALSNLSGGTSNNNLGLGAGAGSQIVYGSDNVFIGGYNGINLIGQSGHVVLSDGAGRIKMFWDNVGNSRHNGILHIGTDTNAVASTGSGALRVDGGVGIAKDLHVGGSIYTQGWAVSTGSSATPSMSNVSISTTPPSGATTGTLWFDDIGGRMYLYHTSEWVDTSPALTGSGSQLFNLGLSASAPTGAVAGSFAVADGTNWDPGSKSGLDPYPVFYNGATWTALY